jgi:hypothetical protein
VDVTPSPPPDHYDEDDLDGLDEIMDQTVMQDRVHAAKRRALQREFSARYLAEHPEHRPIERIVDNRIFLLGLDQLVRERMQHHERNELLTCARAVAERLSVSPADVPIEGYYSQTKRLTEYFRLMRGLQTLAGADAGQVTSMPEFQRLRAVASSPLYGRPVRNAHGLLPVGRDPLSLALYDSARKGRWTIESLVTRAHDVAVETRDFSLVGLACVARDPVVLAALRESMVLYAERAVLSRESYHRAVTIYVYPWRVDEALALQAARFVATFNELFDEDLPAPLAENADIFFSHSTKSRIVGRCVCVAQTDGGPPYYHWVVRQRQDQTLYVEDFWDDEIATTKKLWTRAAAARQLPNSS